METNNSPLILTKLQPPAPRQKTISRARLMKRLSAAGSPGFTLVCAAAGYGKTTLLGGWAHSLQAQGRSVAWYALDAGDDSPAVFAAYLTASITGALGPLPELTHLEQAIRTSTGVELRQVVGGVINAVLGCDQECVLIIDDYHLVTSPDIHTVMAYLLEHLPPNLRVVIGSRSDPPLPLARFRAGGRLLELRAADLRFTVVEAGLFLNEVMELNLPESGVAELEASTEGWVTGLQLAGLSLAAQAENERMDLSFGGSHRYLTDYLMAEVVNRQPRAIQDFLQATSILERMNAQLCQALAGRAAWPEDVLAHLEQSNLFVVTLDDQRVWYRYHHLFRDFLQARLKKSRPESFPGLHKAACLWLAAAGYLHEAANHAFQVGDWEYAAAFVEQHTFTLILHSDIATVYDWCSRFPEEIMLVHPLLCVHQCWALAMTFKAQHRTRVESRLKQAESASASIRDPLLLAQITESIMIIRTFLAMTPDPAADPQISLALARELLSRHPEGDPSQFSALLLSGYAYMALHKTVAAGQALRTARQIAQSVNLYFGVVESSFNLARLLQFQGQLDEAARVCREGQSVLAGLLENPEKEVPAIGSLDIAMGCVLLEQDHLEQAEDHLQHGLELLAPGSNPEYIFAGCSALARLYTIQGRHAQAEEYLGKLEEAWPDIAFCTRGLRVEAAQRTAPEDPAVLEQAAAWCQAFEELVEGGNEFSGVGPLGAADVFYQCRLVWAHAQVRLGTPLRAAAYLQGQRALAEEGNLTQRVIELALLQALAAQAAGEPVEALQQLEFALAAGEAEGYVRIYDCGPDLDQLLALAARRGTRRQLAARVRSALVASDASFFESGARSQEGPSGEPRLVESLSAREMEVLRLLAQGATNQQIASRLVITVGTTKSHINHILAKLNAGNRTEAAATARRLKLI